MIMKNKNKTGNADGKGLNKKQTFFEEYEAELGEESFEELSEAEKRMLSSGSVSYEEKESFDEGDEEEFYDGLDYFEENFAKPDTDKEKQKESEKSAFERDMDRFLAMDFEEFFSKTPKKEKKPTAADMQEIVPDLKADAGKNKDENENSSVFDDERPTDAVFSEKIVQSADETAPDLSAAPENPEASSARSDAFEGVMQEAVRLDAVNSEPANSYFADSEPTGSDFADSKSADSDFADSEPADSDLADAMSEFGVILENDEIIKSAAITPSSEADKFDVSVENAETDKSDIDAENSEADKSDVSVENGEADMSDVDAENGETDKDDADDESGETDKTDAGSENSETAQTVENKELTPEELKARKRSRMMYNILMVASLAVFIYCVGRIGVYVYGHFKYKQDMGKLQNMVGSIVKDPNPVQPEVVTDIYFPDEQVYASNSVNYNTEISETWADTYAGLVQLNSDCVGWLQIPDTQINYPVMFTPGDYDKYLRKDFEGNYLTRGLPFMAEGTQLNISQNYLIYGHNMHDGTAFRDLTKYLDNSWTKEHPYAYFNTASGEGIYEVMAVVISKVFNIEDECFKYYKYSGNLNEDEYNTYVYYMKKMSSYNSGIDAVYGDQLLSLSTCYKVYDENGRLVVLFKRIQ